MHLAMSKVQWQVELGLIYTCTVSLDWFHREEHIFLDQTSIPTAEMDGLCISELHSAFHFIGLIFFLSKKYLFLGIKPPALQ